MSDEPVMVEGLISVAQTEIALLLESGHLLMEMNKFKEAGEVFSGVAALVPQSEVPLVCLGNLAFSQGKHDRALKFQRDAVERQPDSALALAHRGEAYAFVGKKDLARADLERAVELDGDGPSGAFAASVLEALQEGVI